ncbi:(2Fe-2S)-binding protein [Desulfomicrobium escambiense]|uniref:(2Fe-2S)-binding protein n=1 Tax=Desulfomicrobium escambiense TaxID=29503 RepID=UPI0004042743|nr:(2Fe-2S)-binding protein [Desulfomicrobium escambiense]
MISLKVNGTVHEVDADPGTPLLWVLRDGLGLTSVKYGCGEGMCGICTVLVDGRAERSCVTPVESVQGSEILTIEGLPEDHPVKVAWTELQVPQCGYCQTGMMLQAVDVLTAGPGITDGEMAAAMDGIACRCGSHPRVIPAMRRAAGKMKEETP